MIIWSCQCKKNHLFSSLEFQQFHYENRILELAIHQDLVAKQGLNFFSELVFTNFICTTLNFCKVECLHIINTQRQSMGTSFHSRSLLITAFKLSVALLVTPQLGLYIFQGSMCYTWWQMSLSHLSGSGNIPESLCHI